MAPSSRLYPAFRRMRMSVLDGGLIRPGDSVLVACSGGPDSTALLHLLLELSRDLPFAVSVAHFNHQLRPRSGAADERFVQNMALALDLPYFAGRADVRAEARKKGFGIEDAGRRLRYKFLERAAAEAGAAKIATGHTLNDQAETVLMRILRGTGPAGLAGIPAFRGGVIIRPLLGLERGEIIDYLNVRKLAWRTDDSNRDEKYLRNKVRRNLIPYLEKEFSAAVVRSLARLASVSRDEDDFMEENALAAASKAVSEKAGEPFLDADALNMLAPALARRVVRIFLRELKGDLLDVSFDDIEAVRAMRDGGELPISKTLVLSRLGNRICRKKRRVPAPSTFAFLWDGRGALPISGTGLEYRGRFFGPAAARASLAAFSANKADRKQRRADDEAGCILDAATLAFPLIVRARRPGDRYHPLGAPGGKKLKEILRAKGVSADDRGRRPVFISGNEIVWVQGLPASEKHKVTARTKRIFRISAVPVLKNVGENDEHDGKKS